MSNMETCEITTTSIECVPAKDIHTEHVHAKDAHIEQTFNVFVDTTWNGKKPMMNYIPNIPPLIRRRKTRTPIKWNVNLESDFYEAIIKCIKNEDSVIPTNIKKYMENTTITRQNISSHLQKFKKRSKVLCLLDIELYKKYEKEINILEDDYRAKGMTYDDYMTDRILRDLQDTLS